MINLIALLIFSFTAFAEPATIYELRDLHAQGISFYGSTPVNRKYMEFTNADGRHHIVYEESPAFASLSELLSLQQAMGSLNAVCAIDISCSQKAFCTGDCKQMYYEVSNLPNEQIPADHNRCKIQSFSCEKAKEAIASTYVPEQTRNPASLVPPAPAAIPQANKPGFMPSATPTAGGGTKVNVPGVPSFTVPPPPPLNMEE